MKNKYLIYILSSLAILSALFVILGLNAVKTSQQVLNYKHGTINIANKQIEVEIADTFQLHYLGLSGRDELKENSGMLFIFNNNNYRTFCMRGMKFPIDIIWIRDGKIVGFQQNAPADNGLKDYPSPEPVNYVLEVKAGFVEDNHIIIGDQAVFELKK